MDKKDLQKFRQDFKRDQRKSAMGEIYYRVQLTLLVTLFLVVTLFCFSVSQLVAAIIMVIWLSVVITWLLWLKKKLLKDLDKRLKDWEK